MVLSFDGFEWFWQCSQMVGLLFIVGAFWVLGYILYVHVEFWRNRVVYLLEASSQAADRRPWHPHSAR